MRRVTVLEKASFKKEGEGFTNVLLPHTWNNLDGQDGGNDYFRGKGRYQIDLPAPSEGKCQYIQFEGANHIAEVFCNGEFVGVHKGGFSTFRFELTKYLKEEDNILEVVVDNDAPDIYPQHADFTFFGGLYRDISFIEVDSSHFDLLKAGSEGIFVTPRNTGHTRLDVFTVDGEDCIVKVEIKDREDNTITTKVEAGKEHVVLNLNVSDPHLWKGLKDPYLYSAVVSLEKDQILCDQVIIQYGYRSFHVSPSTGFHLNGESYPLRGVSRHQDKKDKGWALNEEDHDQDMELIKEVGANTIRLAHYQHSQYFYELCNKAGMVVWAEIPFISIFMDKEESYHDTINQMTELIAQNYNHPSICFWGISNEITMGGESEALYRNLCDLNALAKKLDPSRLTTMAHIGTVKADSPHSYISDVHGYNLYLGWYDGEVKDNGDVLDGLHRQNPDRALSLSEYGADTVLSWHSASPKNHDYTEEYQAYYHEELLKIFASRPYLWATYVWNMFDFASDRRDEGGCKGLNTKGLVTHDRKIKKDSFYIYKAYWTREPMVHVCGRRFVDRAPGQRDIKVYTNCKEVTLSINGKVVGSVDAQDHTCIFKEVEIVQGENTLTARGDGKVLDTIILKGVDEPNPSYVMPEETIVAGNWFDEETGQALTLEFPEGYYSIKDSIEDIMSGSQGARMIGEIMGLIRGDFNKGQAGQKEEENQGFDRANDETMKAVKSISLERLIKYGGQEIEPKVIVEINRKLNMIKK